MYQAPQNKLMHPIT